MGYIPNQAPLSAITVTSQAAPTVDNLMLIDAATVAYKSISFQLTGAWSGTVSFEGSNDNSTWYPILCQPSGGGTMVSSTDTIGQWLIPVRSRYIRVRNTTSTSGTFSGVAFGSQFDLSVTGQDQTIAAIESDYMPGYRGDSGLSLPLTVDEQGALRIRGEVLTDEGGYRDNASGSAVGFSIGNLSFTNGSTIVTGTGLLDFNISVGDYIRLDADASTTFSNWARISSFNNTTIILESAYTGTTASGASSACILKPKRSSGTGTIAVSSGTYLITADATTTASLELERDADIMPLVKSSSVTISQRVANQNIYVGLYDDNDAHASPYFFAWFNFDGTTNTTVKTETGWNAISAPSASEKEIYTVTIPGAKTSAVPLKLRVEIIDVYVKFYIDDILVSTHYKSMPRPQDLLTSTIKIVNGGSAPTTGTIVTIDYDHLTNINVLSVNAASNTANQVVGNVPSTVLTSSATGSVVHHNVDCSQFRSAYFQLTSIGTSCTMLCELSNDGTTWVTAQMYPAAGGAPVTSVTAVGQWAINFYGAKYFRVRASASYGTQTTTLNLTQEVINIVNASGSAININQVGGTNTVNGGLAGTLAVGGLIAGDSALTVTYKPVAVGGLAKSSTTPYVVSADGDAVHSAYTLNGASVMYPYSVADCTWNYAAPASGLANTTTAVTIKAAAATGIRNYITAIQIQHATLSGVTEFAIRNGSAGTVLWRTQLQTTALPLTSITFPVPLRGTAATLLEIVELTAVTGAIYFNAQGFIGA